MSRYEIQIKKDYTFTLDRNQFNDTAICTFKSPKIEQVFCVVVRGFNRYGVQPFFDVIVKDNDIILTGLHHIKDLWATMHPHTPFDLVKEQKYDFGFLPPKVFRFNLQPTSQR